MLSTGCMRIRLLVFSSLFVMLFFTGCVSEPLNPDQFPTRAESSGFTETALYDDIMSYLRTLDEESGHMRLTSMGHTAEGRAIPLAVLGSPPPKDPSRIDRRKTTVVYIQANIHSGEIDGKEACLMLIRDLAIGPLSPLLEGIVVLVAPDYNADGNERIDPGNRTRQPGPKNGVGSRSNAQSLDLNREMMKLESPEAQSLVRNILIDWDPNLVVDCHTTNGSYHQEPITYAPPHNPLCDPELLHYNTHVMLPWIVKETEEREGYLSIPYGNFANRTNPSQGWYTFDHMPRYVTNYIGLRNRLSILIEMYMHAEYEVRVRACRAFLQSIVAHAHEKGPEMRAVTGRADAGAITAASPGGTPQRFHTAFERKALEKPITIKGYKMEVRESPGGRGRGGAQPNFDEPVEYTVPYFGMFEPQGDGIPLPDAYIFPRALFDIRDKLVQHGITVEEVKGPFTAIVDAFNIEKVDFQERLYQGHRIQRLEGQWDLREIAFANGAFVVPTNQPLAMLAAYLLEPESDDGLACWNFMDRYLGRGPWDSRPGTYPAMRMKSRKPVSAGQ